ncbi:MAG: helix-turn-helix domain-containing protein [Halobacteriaceae archaeon]
MSVIAIVALDSPVLAEALSATPTVEVTVVQETLPAGRPARLMFWADGGDHDAFEDALDADESVADVVRLTSSEERTLFRVDVADDREGAMTYPALTDLDIALLAAEGSADGWSVRLRAPDRPSLQRYVDHCRESGLSVAIERIYTQSAESETETRLTPVQREVLELALAEGYFEIPRKITTNELGERLGISGQAVSERLRRALRKTATRTLESESENLI